ncbi:MAG: 7TM domain-containing protein [Candidatus Dojkabacteria bacterium]|nr:7TM domain-containing protein [Candidatus Dojkabacteria bacterium]MDQ7021764.1 7TM domain-containing protein [Candidatus Dojkabacteria bacterium]
MDTLIEILRNRNLTKEEIGLLENSFLLLMTLPIVTTISGIARYIIGLKSLSVYAPIVLTFAFYELGYIEADKSTNVIQGLKFGLVLFMIVLLVSTLTYKLIRRVRMHYTPKATIVLMAVSISVIMAMCFGTLLFEKKGLIYLDAFSVIMIMTLSDQFVSLLSRKSLNHTLIVATQTLTTSVISYSIISLNATKDFALNYSLLLILGLLFINFFVGKFIGLRLTEYIRFKELIFRDTEEENGDGKHKQNKKK